MTMTYEGTWRGPILQHFTADIAEVAPLTVVGDPDEVFGETGILTALADAGFEVVKYGDPVAFRYVYETHRLAARASEWAPRLVVIAAFRRAEMDQIPYDISSAAKNNGRHFSFDVGDVFPGLNPTVVSALSREGFDALYDAQQTHQPGQLGINATKDFILRHVFEIAPELIKTSADLLRMLLRHHYRGRHHPEMIEQRLVELLMNSGNFSDWPLGEIVANREAFFGFLEERWVIFVRNQRGDTTDSVGFISPPSEMRYPGPTELPFEHDDVRVYLDNLFLEGQLEKAPQTEKRHIAGTWLEVGVVSREVEDLAARFEKLTISLNDSLSNSASSHFEWLDFATVWAEWSGLRWGLPPQEAPRFDDAIQKLETTVDQRFSDWMVDRYRTLHNLPHLPHPAMVHQIPRFIASRHRAQPLRRKIALVVIDGMSLSQWQLIRGAVKSVAQRDTWSEGNLFAWVPTLTSVSRQAIFAAEPPAFFGSTIQTTQKEGVHWKRFWQGDGLAGTSVSFVGQKRHEPDEVFLPRVKEEAEDPSVHVLGVVINTIDEMLHGTVTGSRGLHGQVRQWGDDGHLCRMVEVLVDRDYSVYITSDHGNIQATGIGKPNVGAIADERGERVHVFPDSTTRRVIAESFPESIVWDGPGLPRGYHPLFTGGHTAFVQKGARTVAHGGISLDEVVVPFVGVGAK